MYRCVCIDGKDGIAPRTLFDLANPPTHVTRLPLGSFSEPVTARILLLFIALGAGLMLHAQPPAENRTDAQGRKQGAWSKTWPNGEVRYTGQFIDDKPVGTFIHYNEDGVITSQQDHAGDGVTSRAVHFHPDGEVMARGKYTGQVKDSIWNYYDDLGRLQSVERFVNGELQGERVVYYADGGIAETSVYDHGHLHGPWRQYFQGGKPKAQGGYVHGIADGRMTWYHPNGKTELDGLMEDGERDGVWTYYNEDGSLLIVITYADGDMVESRKMNGVFKEYFDDEKLKEEVTWKNGAMNGPFTEYHDNGTWETREIPANAATGEPAATEQVLTGQTKKRTGTYRNGLLEGEVKHFGENGEPVLTEVYSAGKLVSSTP